MNILLCEDKFSKVATMNMNSFYLEWYPCHDSALSKMKHHLNLLKPHLIWRWQASLFSISVKLVELIQIIRINDYYDLNNNHNPLSAIPCNDFVASQFSQVSYKKIECKNGSQFSFYLYLLSSRKTTNDLFWVYFSKYLSPRHIDYVTNIHSYREVNRQRRERMNGRSFRITLI